MKLTPQGSPGLRRWSTLSGLLAVALSQGGVERVALDVRCLCDMMPAGVRIHEVAVGAAARRIYYTDTSGEIWLFDRDHHFFAPIATGDNYDLTLSKLGDALAFTSIDVRAHRRRVSVVPIDTTTGLARGMVARTNHDGDTPSFAPNGVDLAFARDDPGGVSQSIVTVTWHHLSAPERVVLQSIEGGVIGIRWTGDGTAILFGQPPPVACDPEWSCIPSRMSTVRYAATIRRVDARTSAVATLGVGRSFWPGLSPDGTVMVYRDTAQTAGYIVADPRGQKLSTVPIATFEQIEGWMDASTLVVSRPVGRGYRP